MWDVPEKKLHIESLEELIYSEQSIVFQDLTKVRIQKKIWWTHSMRTSTIPKYMAEQSNICHLNSADGSLVG